MNYLVEIEDGKPKLPDDGLAVLYLVNETWKDKTINNMKWY